MDKHKNFMQLGINKPYFQSFLLPGSSLVSPVRDANALNKLPREIATPAYLTSSDGDQTCINQTEVTQISMQVTG